MNTLRAASPFLIFWVLTQAFYWPTWDAGFVVDFTGLLYRFDGSTAADIWNCFGFPALQQALNAILYGFYQAFGITPIAWYLLFTSLHALNGWLLYRFSQSFLRLHGHSSPDWISVPAVLLFLLSPYQSEPVTYRACLSFLLSGTITIGSLNLAMSWLQAPRNGRLAALLLLLAVGLFTFELQLVLPVLLTLLLLFSPQARAYRGRAFRQMLLPSYAIVLAYLGLNRLLLGSWVGHYGSEVHLRFPAGEMVGNAFRYALKTLFWVRDYPHEWKTAVFGWFNQNGLLLGATAVVAGLLIAGLLRYQRLPAGTRAAVFGTLAYGITLLPVANLYFTYLLHVQNDRYGYLPSAFLLWGAAALLSRLPRPVYLGLIGMLIAGNAFFLFRTNQYWQASTDVYRGLMQDYRWETAPAAYLLNLPDNYQGVWMFRDAAGSNMAFRHAMRYVAQKPLPDNQQIYEVASYNMTSPGDGADAKIDSSGQVRVEFQQWGNWWWHKGIGMGPGYETDRYRVDSKGHHYFLQIDSLAPGSVLLRQQGEQWHAVPY